MRLLFANSISSNVQILIWLWLCEMNRNSRLYILVVAALCVTFMYLSQTFIGLIATPYFIRNNIVYRNITNWVRPQMLPTYFNDSAVSNCFRIQNEVKKRIDKYCKTKSLNWTKVTYLVFFYVCIFLIILNDTKYKHYLI